jgi:uncharacterized OB-fold protein
VTLSTWKPKRPEHPDFEQALNLAEAVLCADCETLYHQRRTTCPACASCTSYSLARLLNRKAA